MYRKATTEIQEERDPKSGELKVPKPEQCHEETQCSRNVATKKYMEKTVLCPRFVQCTQLVPFCEPSCCLGVKAMMR